MNRYRVGIIGCGSVARSHVDGYRRVEVVAVADSHPAAREQFREEFGRSSGLRKRTRHTRRCWRERRWIW